MIVKPSELTRTRREGGRGKGKGEEKVLDGCFLAMKLHIGVPRGRKVQNQGRKMEGGKPTKKTHKKQKNHPRQSGW